MTAIGNQSNPEHSSLAVATKTPQLAGGREGGKKVVAEREKIKMWISRELSSKKQSKGLTSQLFEYPCHVSVQNQVIAFKVHLNSFHGS